MADKRLMSSGRARDTRFCEHLRALETVSLRGGGKHNAVLTSELIEAIDTAIRVRCCSFEDVIIAITNAQQSGSVLDELPTIPPIAAEDTRPDTPGARRRY